MFLQHQQNTQYEDIILSEAEFILQHLLYFKLRFPLQLK